MKKIYSFIAMLILSVLFFAGSAQAQSTANYTFSTVTNGSLTDMSSGTTDLVAAGQDQTVSSVTNMGFTFYFMGVPYTQFNVSANGMFRFGSTLVGGTTYGVAQLSQPLISPFARDLMTNTTGKIHYKVTGTSPNQILIVEFLNMEIDWTSSTADGTYQLRLYENTGVIEFVYGSMSVGVGGGATGFSLGISSSSSDNTYATINTALGTVTRTVAPSTNSYTAGSTIPNLHSTSNGSRRVYSFTPPAAPNAPTNLTFTSVGLTSYTLNWTDNATNELGYGLWRSTDGINYNFIGTLAANTVTYNATGLSAGTTYYWRIATINEGLASSYLSGSQATTSGTLSGNKYIGNGSFTMDYATLTDAFTAINTNGLSGNINLILNTTYTATDATFPIVGPNTAVGNYTVTIYPSTTGRVITSSGTSTINLNGSKNVVFDGRVNATGTTKDLVIENTSAGGNAIQFMNDANSNTLKYCTIRGINTSTTNGVIVFSTTTGSNGNDNNTIDNCDLKDGSSTPTNIIYSVGTTTSTTHFNSNNTISNCNIYNFSLLGGSASGIYLGSGNTDWTVSGNNFYQTATRTKTAGATDYGIYASNSGNNFIITNNYIGGGAINCGGTAWTVAGAFANRFVGIYLSVGAATASSIQGNTIANYSWSSTSGATTLPGVWCGVYLASGNANIGNVTGNTIGATTGTGNVSITSSTTGAISFGIGSAASSSTVNISNNNIGSISAIGTTTLSHSFVGIQTTSGTTLNINANNIGSSVTANSINASNAATSTTGQHVAGILNSSSATLSITNNNIYNLNNAYNGTGTTTFTPQIRGIVSSSGINTITGNTIRNLSYAGPYTGTTSTASVIGISLTSTTAGTNLSQNTVYALSNTNTTAATCITGIHYGGATSGTNVVARNFVHSLSLATSSATADMRGINFASGIANVQNNMIRLGIDASGAAISNGIQITGLYDVTSTTGTGMYFNSIYIGGSGVGTGTGNTYAFRSNQTTNTRIYQNNIFFNARSNATTGGKHYGVMVSGTGVNPTGLTLNYNDYYVTGTGGVFGYYNADVANFAAWKSAVGQDANSINGDPQFINPSGTSSTVDLHIHSTNPTPIEASGLAIGSVTNDYDGQTRSDLTPTDIGADAGNFVGSDIAPPTISYTVLGNTTSTTSRTLTASISDLSGIPTSGIGLPVLYWRINAGTWNSAQGVFISGNNYDFTFGAGVVASDVVSYYIVAQDMAGTPNVGAYPSGGAGGFTANPPAASTPPTTPSSYTILGSISGIKTVGSGGDYATLTAAITALNNNILSGALEFRLLDATYTTPAEAFPLVINVNSGSSATNTVTIKPNTGVQSTITGSSTSSIFQINGADYITIDGSNNGSSSRNLTVENTNIGTSSAVIWTQTTSGADAATNCTIKNINITGSGNTQTLIGIGFGGTTISTSSLGTGNNSNTITNNNISKTQYGIYSQGASSANKNQSNVISNNLMNTATPNNVSKGGVWLGFENNITVSGNQIDGITLASSPDVFGIALGLTGISTSSFTGNEVTNATVSKNYIGKVTNTGTYSACGITLASATSGNTTISNNVITGVGANGTSGDFGAGIFLGGGTGSTTQIYYNSVSMTGTLTGGSYPNFCLAIGGSDPITDVRNNIFYNTLVNGTGHSVAIGTASSTFVNLTSNYNDFFTTTGSTFFIGYTGGLAQGTGVTRIALSDWKTSTNKDANSISANPLFLSNTDLRPSTGSPVLNAATPIAGLTTDYLGLTRSITTPTIGAYENAVDLSAPVISYTQLTGTLSTGNRTLNATITDGSGVPTSGSLVPRIYYKKGLAGSWYSQPGSLVSGSGTNGSWDLTIISADMGGVATGDNIYYYVIAQDIATPINLVSNPTGAVATDVNNVSSHPVSPNFYTILGTFSAGTYAIGPSGTYMGYDGTFATMTEAINSLNTSSIDGDCMFEFQDDYDGTTVETLPLNFNPIGYNGGTFNVTFRPAASNVNPTVISGDPGNSNSLLTLNGTSNLIIDGRPGGTGSTGQMSMVNTNASTPGGTVYIQNEASNVTLRYLTIQGNNASTSSGVVTVKSSSGSNANDNITITYCDIANYTGGNPNIGVWVEGISSSATNDNFVLSYSKIHEFGANVASTNPRGLYIGKCNNASITNNSFYRSTALTAQGLSQILVIGATGNGAGYTITDNFFGGSAPSASGTFTVTTSPSGVYVIDIVDIASQTSASTFTGNTIKGWNLTTTSDAASNTISFVGLLHRSTAGSVNVNNNTIGDNTANATTNPSIVLTTGGVSTTNYNVFEGIDLRAGTGTINYNTIGGVRLLQSGARNLGFTGINHSTAGTPSIDGNTIGSPSTSLFDNNSRTDKVKSNIDNIRKRKENNSGTDVKELKITPNTEKTENISNSNINKQVTDVRYFHSEVTEVSSVKIIETQELKQSDKLTESRKSKNEITSETSSKSSEITDNIIPNISGNNGNQLDNVIIPNISNETSGGFVGIQSIYAGSITNNLIANVSMNPTTPTGTLQTFTGISISNSSIATANNTVTGNTVRNIFNSSINGTSAGIVTTTNTTGVLTCTNNNVRNITFTSPSAGTATFCGILIQGSGNYTVTGNNIYTFNSNSNSGLNASGQNVFTGIYQVNTSAASTNLIGSNNIYDVTCNPFTTSTSVKVQGIFNNSSTSAGIVSKNKIYNLLTNSSAVTSMVCGYNSFFGASWTYSNNVFNLGDGIASDILVHAVFDYSDNNTGYWYYNTFRVGGTVTSGSISTSAYFRNSTASTVTAMQNNILANFRTGGTGSHLAVNNAIGATGWTLSNFNNFYSANIATIGRWGSATDLTIDGWRTGSSLDAYSVSWNPGFISSIDLTPNTSDANSWSISGNGIHIGTVTDDINGTPRPADINAGAPDIGAYQFGVPSVEPNNFNISVAGVGTTNLVVNGRKMGSLYFSAVGTLTSVDVKFYTGKNPPGTGGYPSALFMNAYYTITPNGGASGFTYDVIYNYSEPQRGTIVNENVIRLAKSDNNGTNWTSYSDAGTGPNMYLLDVNANTIKVHGLTAFSTFTNSDANAPLPVTLSSFNASLKGRDVTLSWKTESEINNAGFDVERKLDGTNEWKKAGFVNGKGNSNSPVNYTFEDKKLNSGKYNYRLKQIDNNGNYTYHSLSTIVDVALPTKFNLSQNYPNPFNPTTKIDFDLPFDSKVNIVLYDMTGREVKTLVNDARTAGYYTVQFNASDLSSGTYFYRIMTKSAGGDYMMTKKMMLVK